MKFSKKMKEALSSLLLVFSEVSTDKGILSYDTEELIEGSEVFLVAEDGERSKPEDGDYVMEDGRTLKVSDGKVAEIIEKAEEITPTEEEPVKVEAEKTELDEEKVEHEEEPTPEPEPETVEEVVEAVEEIKEEVKEEVDTVSEVLAIINSKLAELEERLSKLENTPAAEPIAEEFSKATKALKTNDGHLEFLKKMAASK